MIASPSQFVKLHLSVIFGWGVVLGTWLGIELHRWDNSAVIIAILLLSLRYKFLSRFSWGGIAVGAVTGFALSFFFNSDEFDFPGAVLVGVMIFLLYVTFTGAFVSAYNLLKETLILLWKYSCIIWKRIFSVKTMTSS